MREKEIMHSDTTGRDYYPVDSVRLVNVKQLLFYMNHGVEILDFYPSNDFKTGEPILVFVVDKLKTQMIYKKWNDLKNNESKR